MGIFVRTIANLADGGTVQIPAKTGNLNKVYVTSANLTYVDVETNAGNTQIPKAVSTDYQSGFFPVQESIKAPLNITVHGPSSAEDITIICEFV